MNLDDFWALKLERHDIADTIDVRCFIICGWVEGWREPTCSAPIKALQAVPTPSCEAFFAYISQLI